MGAGTRSRFPLARTFGTLVMSLAVVGAACSGNGGAAQDDGPIRMAASLPLTGAFSTPGEAHQEGYEFCVDKINEAGGLLGRDVELITSDNRSDTETVVNQYERFINVNDADILLGTFSTLLSFPSSAIAEQAQMVYPEPSDSSLMSHSRGYKFNFGFTLKPIDYIGQTPVDALDFFRNEGMISDAEFPRTAAVVFQDDFFPNSISNGLLGGELEIPGSTETVDFGEGYLAESGIEVVYNEQFPGDFNDWVSLATELKRADADFLFALTVPPTEIDLVNAMSTVGYNPDFGFFSQGTSPDFLDALGNKTEGILVWSTWDSSFTWEGQLGGEAMTNQQFVEEFETDFGRAPDEDVAQALAACMAMDQAVRATGSTNNVELRDWLASRTAEDPARTILGDYYWDDVGLTAGRDVTLLQWQNNRLRLVYPIDKDFPEIEELQFPKPPW
jgi:branched-chain amino acid transport system substrate-binding protein